MTPFHLQTNGVLDLSSFFDHSHFYLYTYARIALFKLLEKLNIKTIYVPSLICRDIIAPINTLGIQYFFYEVDQKLNPINLEKQCDAILFVNYFGFEADITPFKEYQQKHQAILIEDNAHGFLSKDREGKWLGTRGDFGIFSLRKTFSLSNGAILSVNNPDFFDLIFHPAQIDNNSNDAILRKKENLKKFSPSLAYWTMKTRQFFRYLKTGNPLPNEDYSSEFHLPQEEFVTSRINGCVLQFDMKSEIDRRKSMYKKIQELAKKHNISSLCDFYDNCSPFVFPFISDENTQAFQKDLKKQLFFTLPWPSLPKNINSKKTWYQAIRVVPFLW